MSGKSRSEAGSALVEFLSLTILLLLPIFYLILTITELHAGKFAAASAAQSASRAFVTASDATAAQERALAATRVALDDQGFTDISAEKVLRIACEHAACLVPDQRVEVDVEIPVQIPGIPFVGKGPQVMTATGKQTAQVERFRTFSPNDS